MKKSLSIPGMHSSFALFICIWLPALSSCNSHEVTAIDVASQKIDSLIEIQHF
ncbi:MAG: hypothetical protein HGB14_13535 [Anaerolineaceae bacterium]|nr:hypothetical protein [Anaerolineaceae bacterium]